ncbi:MAG: NAD-dependent DNA ligase LigA [Parcubacteria group bacterium]|nr:NAD-dependent DNA ligase LigA [Parcubacteria group bacterium]
MDKHDAKKRIEKLRDEINHHRYLYHVLDKQEISDAALDSLKNELLKLEQQFPELITPDSPTQRVAGEPLKKFKKIKHSARILSLEDVFNFDELSDWETRAKKLLPQNTRLSYFCELKIDGVDIVLTYEDGLLKHAATRGDGIIGEDVTNTVKTIEAIPLQLEKNALTEKNKIIVARGEIFMRKKDFNAINAEQKKKKEPLFANPRNIVSGSIRQLDPAITASRKLDCMIFEIITDLGQKTHEETHTFLKKLGFKTDPSARHAKTLNEIKHYHEEWLAKREKAPFWYDGIVVVINDIEHEQKLGHVGKAPRWMAAYKFPAEEATTIIKNIIVQVGRTGALTPVAIFEPTPLAGTMVSRATLHNADEIERLDARVNDTVIIKKAGDIIPDVVKVLPHLRTGKEKRFKMPEKCPRCGEKIVRKEGEVGFYCVNKNCFARTLRYLAYFTSKKAFGIEGLSHKILERFLNEGLVKTAADIFTLKKSDIEHLERFGELSASNIIDSIEKSKKILFHKFIFSLGIRHIGERSAEDLARHFKTIDDFTRAAEERLLAINEIGDVTAREIIDWLRDKNNIQLIHSLLHLGVEIIYPSRKNLPLEGKSFSFTGGLQTISREVAKEKVVQLGGIFHPTPNKDTSFVIAGEEAGSKLEKAKKLGLTIIDEKEFLKILG